MGGIGVDWTFAGEAGAGGCVTHDCYVGMDLKKGGFEGTFIIVEKGM